jgi:iron-sulfur cluster repair protein YtfE (RIC family)
MLMPSPTVRSAGARVPAQVARFRVLEQHRELRQLLETGLDLVRGALGGNGQALWELPALLDRTHQAFRCHLAEEESLLLPILDDDVPVGPMRAAILRQEHDRQRAEMEALAAKERSCTMDELAARYSELVQALLMDMEAEERELLTPDVIRDDGIVIDQCSG